MTISQDACNMLLSRQTILNHCYHGTLNVARCSSLYAYEITVALQHEIPVIFVVLNDSELGMVKHGQKLGGAEEIGFELPKIDYAMMAEAMGIEGITIETPQELVAIDWQRLGEKQAPTMINVIIDPNEVPPMGQRVKGLADKNKSATPGG